MVTEQEIELTEEDLYEMSKEVVLAKYPEANDFSKDVSENLKGKAISYTLPESESAFIFMYSWL